MTASVIPEIHASLSGSTATVTVFGGPDEQYTADTEHDVKALVMNRTVGVARELGTHVRLVSTQPNGEFRLLVAADGTITDDALRLTRVLPPLASEDPATPTATAVPAVTVVLPPPPPTAEELSPRRQARMSFLAQENRILPAAEGWRGILARTVRADVKPSAAELARREHVRLASQHWPGPRKVGVANGKGGVGKTMTTAMLAAVFARYGGAGVLAWDNNDTRGTLGWRTEQGPHDATVQDLLPATERLLSPTAQVSQLAHFVHHQTADKYDVLRSNPELLAAKQRIERDEFDALHDVLAKYYRVILFDSGNDESAERWLRMIDHTDQLVVPTSAAGESAESAALLLEALLQRDERSAELARNAVVIVSQSERGTSLGEAERIANGFADLARSTVIIPFDRALKSGPLRFEALATATQQAWLAAGAAVAGGL